MSKNPLKRVKTLAAWVRKQMPDKRRGIPKLLVGAAVIGAIVGCVWMYITAAAITYGVSFPISWTCAAYISCPVIWLCGPNFLAVVAGNALLYAVCASILRRLLVQKTLA